MGNLQEAPKFNRRRFLVGATAGVAAAASGAFLTACGGEPPKPTPTTQVLRLIDPFPSPTPYPKPPERPKGPSLIERASAILENAIKNDKVIVPTEIQKGLEVATIGYLLLDGGKKFCRARVFSWSEQSAQTIIELAQKGGLWFENNHPVNLAELDGTQRFASQPQEIRDELTKAYVRGILSGLEKVYDKNTPAVIMLEAGHQSNPSKEIRESVEKINRERTAKGWLPISITSDTGNEGITRDGKRIAERQLTLAVSKLIAAAILEEYPKWEPVLNCKDDGFPVYRFTPYVDERINTVYIGHGPSIMPMRYKQERLAEALNKAKIIVTRVAIHLDAPYASGRIGSIITPNDHSRYARGSMEIAKALSDSLNTEIKKVTPDYSNFVDRETNNQGFPYWSLDTSQNGNKGDVVKGNTDALRTAGAAQINIVLAEMRREMLDRSKPTPTPTSNRRR